MKAVTFNGTITSIRGKVDKSVGLTISTPELTVEEKSTFFELQGVDSDILISPKDMQAPEYKIDKEIETKTPGQRLRAVVYVLYSQLTVKEDFNEFYRKYMEKIIDRVKEQLV